MNVRPTYLVLVFFLFMSACGGDGAGNAKTANPNATAEPAATQAPTPKVPANGDYPGKGKVTKINLEMGSVELDHEEIKEVMPAMLMEFFVSDKKLLNGLKIGDTIEFTLRYKDGQETIVDIKKAK